MERLFRIILTVMLSGVFLSAPAWAQYGDGGGSRGYGGPDRPYRGDGGDGPDQRQRRPRKNCGMLIGRFLHQGMAMEVLTEMTGQPANTIKAQAKSGGMRRVLQTYSIDREKFRQAMDRKTGKLLEEIRRCNLLSREQVSEMQSIMKRRKERGAQGGRRGRGGGRGRNQPYEQQRYGSPGGF